MTPAPPYGSGDIWLAHLSTARADPATVSGVAGSAALASRRSILTVVVDEQDSIHIMEQEDLPSGQLSEVRQGHVKGAAAALTDLLASATGTAVLVAADRIAQLVCREVVHELDHVVAADTLEGALRVVAMLRTTGNLDEVLHPPGFSVALSVANAGMGLPATAGTIVTVDSGPHPPGTAWLTVGAKDLKVRTHGMGRWTTRAVLSRQGLRRQVVEDASRRLLLGPANYAGQGGEWARAVRAHAPGWTARSFHVVPPRASFVFGADLPLTSDGWAEPATRLDLAVELVVGATDIVVEAMRPLLAVGAGTDAANNWDTRQGREDADALRASGRNVALLFHGSEVRRPRVNARLTPWSPFYRSQSATLTANLERTTERVHAELAGFGGPVIVSTLDLLDHVPAAVWLPIVVGAASFSPQLPAMTGHRLVVGHAPSRSWLKGTEWVDPVLQRMEREGLLTYRRLENLPPIMVPSMLSEVDVLIDQIVLGGTGVLAAQAMAAGRLVMAHLPEAVRRRYSEPPPVVETTPATVEQVLLSVIENPEHYSKIAQRGVGFARKFHDGRLSAQVLTEALS